MKTRIGWCKWILIQSAALLASASAQTVAGDALTWFSSSSTTGSVAMNSGTLTLNTAGVSGAVVSAAAHFTPITLGLGDSVSLSFDFKVNGLVAGTNINGFRFGLFDSQEVYFTADGQNPSTNAYRGYTGNLNPQHSTSGTASLRLSERTGTDVFMTGAGAYTTLRNNAGLPVPTATDTLFHVKMDISHDDELTTLFTITMSGGTLVTPYTLTTADTSGLVGTFDTIGFSIQNSNSAGGVSQIELSNIQVVPEPATYALLSGLVVGGLVLRRRLNVRGLRRDR